MSDAMFDGILPDRAAEDDPDRAMEQPWLQVSDEDTSDPYAEDEDIPAPVSESTQEVVKDMTRQEAEETDQAIRSASGKIRLLVFAMHKRKGWKALRYQSFETVS